MQVTVLIDSQKLALLIANLVWFRHFLKTWSQITVLHSYKNTFQKHFVYPIVSCSIPIPNGQRIAHSLAIHSPAAPDLYHVLSKFHGSSTVFSCFLNVVKERPAFTKHKNQELLMLPGCESYVFFLPFFFLGGSTKKQHTMRKKQHTMR